MTDDLQRHFQVKEKKKFDAFLTSCYKHYLLQSFHWVSSDPFQKIDLKLIVQKQQTLTINGKAFLKYICILIRLDAYLLEVHECSKISEND